MTTIYKVMLNSYRNKNRQYPRKRLSTSFDRPKLNKEIIHECKNRSFAMPRSYVNQQFLNKELTLRLRFKIKEFNDLHEICHYLKSGTQEYITYGYQRYRPFTVCKCKKTMFIHNNGIII